MDHAHTFTGPYDDYDRDDKEALAIRLTYLRMAHDTAFEMEAEDDVINYLVEQHDNIFKKLCDVDDAFRDRVLNTHKIKWLGGYAPENIAKYKGFAKESSAN